MSGFRDDEPYDALALADLVRRRFVTPDELLDAAIERRPRRDAVEFAKRAAQEHSNGDQTMRFPAFQQGTGGLFHRHGSDRSAVRCTRSTACTCYQRLVRAGARSAGHTHPLGQILIVTAGVGRVQQWGGPVQEIRPGDVVRIPPGVKHWHGAAPTTAMTHIALTEELDGTNTDWLEKVSDEQYGQ